MQPTFEEVSRILSYNPVAGSFKWKQVRRGVPNVNRVGAKNFSGYLVIGLFCKGQYAHRVAHLLMTGKWPSMVMDHINGNKLDNRWANLRHVTHSVNLQNQKRAARTSKTGFLGVGIHSGGFTAQIQIKRKKIHLGLFSTPEAAHAAYLIAKRRLHAGCSI